jgi:hypothetical protein
MPVRTRRARYPNSLSSLLPQSPLIPPVLIQDESLLKIAISSALSSDYLSNALQLEYLKSTLAQVSSTSGNNRVLTASAEQLLTTASNSSWIDRQLMYDFFLQKVGLGAAVSLRCATACVDRGVPSPQYLASEVALQWLGATSPELTLLKAALAPYRTQTGSAASDTACSDEQEDGLDEQVWVEVNTPLSLFDAVYDDEQESLRGANSAVPLTLSSGHSLQESSEESEFTECNSAQRSTEGTLLQPIGQEAYLDSEDQEGEQRPLTIDTNLAASVDLSHGSAEDYCSCFSPGTPYVSVPRQVQCQRAELISVLDGHSNL